MKVLLIGLAAVAAALFVLLLVGFTLGLWGGEVVCESNGVEVPCDETQDKAPPPLSMATEVFPMGGHVMEAFFTRVGSSGEGPDPTCDRFPTHTWRSYSSRSSAKTKRWT